jgi:hypothetical protein
VVQSVNGIDLATDVVVASGFEEVFDRRVLRIASEDLLGLPLSAGCQ